MSTQYLYHHGILNQKWGVRRFQNPDGSLTEEGRKRYGVGEKRKMSKNTEERIKQGAKIGSRAGAAIGIASYGMDLAALAGMGFILNPAGVLAAGAIQAGVYFCSGYLQGAAYGGIVGALETRKARKLIESQSDSLDKIKVESSDE